MCGIAGYQGSEQVGAFGPAILAQLAHRGPDGAGSHVDVDAGIALFHTRLAIQDLSSAGAQPMVGAGARIVLVFNGEIYNFRELRTECARGGYAFRSNTDTEVLIALYLAHGEGMLARLNGVFAFALWDGRERRLLLARDGVGVKPLYYAEAERGLAFASELKALRCFPCVPREPDMQALAHYTRLLWCPGPRSPLRGVSKLEPGEAMWVRAGKVERRWRFYDLPIGRPAEAIPELDLAARVREALALAVKRQMVADVPVGAFLSGGLDSSAIAVFAREHSATRLQCFTIDFDQRSAREEGFVRDLPYAERVARHLDVDLHVVRVGAEMADDLASMVWQLDEPQADFAALNTLYISRLARRRGIPVLLSGAGGDDVFSGYRRHVALRLEAVWSALPESVRRLAAGVGRWLPSRPAMARRAGKLLASASLTPDARLVGYFDWLDPATDAIFSPEFTQASTASPLHDALARLPEGLSPLQRMLLLEQRYFLTEHNLNYSDKMSMAVGVEVRVPFLDPDLMALAATIPDRYRVRGGRAKWILKRAMEGLLPMNVIHRPKTGFGVPLRAWLRGPLRDMSHELLGPDSLRRRGMFNTRTVADMLKRQAAGHGDQAYALLSLMCIELWCRQFIDAPPQCAVRGEAA